tara:strand:+ start:1890 stop:2009 length:120 start_codon:yes stop_codon:yes gene_type:complete
LFYIKNGYTGLDGKVKVGVKMVKKGKEFLNAGFDELVAL